MGSPGQWVVSRDDVDVGQRLALAQKAAVSGASPVLARTTNRAASGESWPLVVLQRHPTRRNGALDAVSLPAEVAHAATGAAAGSTPASRSNWTTALAPASTDAGVV